MITIGIEKPKKIRTRMCRKCGRCFKTYFLRPIFCPDCRMNKLSDELNIRESDKIK